LSMLVKRAKTAKKDWKLPTSAKNLFINLRIRLSRLLTWYVFDSNMEPQIFQQLLSSVFFSLGHIYITGIFGNPAFPKMPRQFRKCLGFPQLPRHLQKMYFFNNVQFLGNGTVLVKNLIKT